MRKLYRFYAMFLVMLAMFSGAHSVFADDASPVNNAVNAAVDSANQAAQSQDPAQAESENKEGVPVKFNITTAPLRYAFVSGDYKKFQAHQWTSAGYSGGIEEFESEFEIPDVDVKGEIDGKAIFGESDYRADVSLVKKDFGFVKFDFKQFRKYFDDTGGVYHPFTTLKVTSIGRELYVDVGKFEVEAGLNVPDFPEVEFYYEHEYKEGAKSRLTWASAIERGVTRKITPSWQEVDESVNVIGLKASQNVKGVKLSGDQRFEFTKSRNRRYERQLALSGLASDKKVRIQDQEPESQLISTTVGGEKWSAEDKVFTSGAYRFVHITAEEDEELREFDEFLNPRSFSNPENKFGNHANNDMDIHTWVANLMYQPMKWLNTNAKLKAEASKRNSDSIYPADTTDPPDRIPNRTEVSVTSNRQFKVGESFAVRFKAIPRTALYTDLDFEQIQNEMLEDRTSQGASPSSGEMFYRQTDTFMPRATWSVGANVAPVRMVTFATQYRLRSDRADYEDEQETVSTASGARSAFTDELNLLGQEITNRVTVRPAQWVQSSFRYVLSEMDYYSRVEDQNETEADTTAHTYIFDTTFTPWNELSFTGSFARRTHVTVVPASSNPNIALAVPDFSSGFNTWTLGANYIPSGNFTVGTTLIYTQTDNFDNIVNNGLPYGSDFDKVGLKVFIKWAIKKGITLKPEYSFYHYDSNPNVETGNYNAHLIGMDVLTEWG